MTEKTRPEVMQGKTMRIETGCGRLYCTLNYQNDVPFEVFIQMGKSGGCSKATGEAQARLISWGLRSGASIEDCIRHLRGIQCHQALHGGVVSCHDAVAVCLKAMSEKTEEKENAS